jgi:histidinol phosphatase-like enzyme
MAESFMIGDRYSDICAGITAGCKSVFIDNHYYETPDFYVTIRTQNLWQASTCILERQLL